MSADIVRQVFELIEAKDTAGAAALLSDNFEFSGAVPEPIGAQEWLGLHDALNAGAPDFSFNIDQVEPHGDVTHITVALSGTHTEELNLSAMGLPTVPATGKSFQLPSEEIAVTVEGGKVTSVVVPVVEGGGVMGILSQLGIEPPPR